MIELVKPKISSDEISEITAFLRGTARQNTKVQEFEEKFALYTGSKFGVSFCSGSCAFTLITSVLFKDSKYRVAKHEYGRPADLKNELKLAKKNEETLIEDCREALGSEYHGKKVGSIGDIGVFDFGHSSNMTTLEGGMVVTNNEDMCARLKALRKAYGVDMTDLSAIIGISQLQKLKTFVLTRRDIAGYYNLILSDVVECPEEEIGTICAFNQYVIPVKNAKMFILNMEENGIEAYFYDNTHVGLPIRPNLMSFEVEHIAETVKAYLETSKKVKKE